MIRASIDRPKLERSLKENAKRFGETGAQAVVRWSVQTCREMAFETQVWGKSSSQSDTKEDYEGKGIGPQAKGKASIIRDARNVLFVAKSIKPQNYKKGTGFLVVMENGGKPFSLHSDRVITTESAVNSWIDMHRTGRKSKVSKIPVLQRKFVSQAIFRKSLKKRLENVGIAKGGWIGAGQDIAKAQVGQERIEIGRSYFSYAQKHAHFGDSKKPNNGWKPVASLTNKASHVALERVLKRSATEKAINFALKKTLSWYKHTIRALDKKIK